MFEEFRMVCDLSVMKMVQIFEICSDVRLNLEILEREKVELKRRLEE
jgi:hypothetical protein